MNGQEDYGTAELDAELATAGTGRGRSFPAHWGYPEGAQYSEERELWIRSHCERATITARFTHLEQAQGRLLAIARNAYLGSIEQTP